MNRTDTLILKWRRETFEVLKFSKTSCRRSWRIILWTYISTPWLCLYCTVLHDYICTVLYSMTMPVLYWKAFFRGESGPLILYVRSHEGILSFFLLKMYKILIIQSKYWSHFYRETTIKNNQLLARKIRIFLIMLNQTRV